MRLTATTHGTVPKIPLSRNQEQVKFQGAYNPGRFSRGFRHIFDFNKPGIAMVKQNMLIYSIVICSRVAAAYQRGLASGSFEEVREHAVRDSLGLTFWFFAGTFMQRVALRLIPKQYRDALVFNPYMESKTTQRLATKTDGWSKFQNKLRQELSFLFKGEVVSAKQAQQRGELIFKHFAESGIKTPKKLERYLRNLRNISNFIWLFGLLITIGLLGIGINFINIAITRKNVAKKYHVTAEAMPVSQPIARPATSSSINPFSAVNRWISHHPAIWPVTNAPTSYNQLVQSSFRH